MRKQFYKVVKKLNTGKQVRYTSVLSENPFSVRYYVHRYVQAPIGGLLVFDDYDAARYFLKDCSDGEYELWQVLIKESIELPTYRASTGPITGDGVIDAWGKNRYGVWLWPLYTQAFKYVRLEKRLFSKGA